MSHALSSLGILSGHCDSPRGALCRWISAFMLILLMCCSWPLLGMESLTSDISRAKSMLANAIQQQRFDEASRAVDELVLDGSKKAIEALVQVGFGGDFYGIERYIGSKLIGIKTGPAFDRLCELATKDSRPSARIILTLVLSARTELKANAALLTNLFDPDDSVALTAVEALAKKDSFAIVDHLIEALSRQEKKGRKDHLLAYEIRRCLLKITGEDFQSATDWTNFWGPRKNNYKKPDPSEKKKGLTSVRRDPPAFFGMEVVAKNVIFLLDVSGSMQIVDVLPEDPGDAAGGGGGAATGVGGEGDTPKPAPTPGQKESRQRIRRVQDELIRTIEKLPPDVQFNVISFNHKIQVMSKGLVRASSRRKREAIQYVRNFNAEGETWTDHALREAFGARGLRAMFLLSDGAPRRDNKLLDTTPILQWVREANRFRRVRINTVGFAQAGKNLRNFMADLAKQNNGEYIELR